MKKSRLIVCVLIFVLMIFSFSGCNYKSGVSIGSFESQNSHSMKMSYIKFTGTKHHELKVDENEVRDLKVDITTEDGSIALTIKNENGDIAYEGHDIPTSKFTVTLSEAGKYSIDIKAKGHKGGCTIDWSEN